MPTPSLLPHAKIAFLTPAAAALFFSACATLPATMAAQSLIPPTSPAALALVIPPTSSIIPARTPPPPEAIEATLKAAKPRSSPAAQSRPFPTPAIEMPAGRRPQHLHDLWFPYLPAPGGQTQWQIARLDDAGQLWEQSAPQNLAAYAPLADLLNLLPAPDHRRVVAEAAFAEPVVIDLKSVSSHPLAASLAGVSFLAWTPDGRQAVVTAGSPHAGAWVIDIESGARTPFPAPTAEFGGYSLLRAAAYSPNGQQVADAVIYPAGLGIREREVLEIGLRRSADLGGERRPLTQIPGGVSVVAHSLQWSPAGERLIVIANIAAAAELSAQLLLIDPTGGSVRQPVTLAQNTDYAHCARWSPDGRSIAVIKSESVAAGRETANNIYLIDPSTGTERQLTRFTGRRLSHLSWSPAGRHLAFTLTLEHYGEIWLTDIEGSAPHPAAGPALPGAAFMWLP